MGGKRAFLPGEIWQFVITDEIQEHNLCSDVLWDCQKSAEVIVPWKDKRSGKD